MEYLFLYKCNEFILLAYRYNSVVPREVAGDHPAKMSESETPLVSETLHVIVIIQ